MKGKRIVFEHDAEPLGAVARLEFAERRLDARAKRALEVGELHDGDGRGRAPPLRGSAPEHRSKRSVPYHVGRVSDVMNP